MIRSSVVLPDPDGPSSARNSPGRASRLTPLSAAKPLKFFVMPLAVTVNVRLPPTGRHNAIRAPI